MAQTQFQIHGLNKLQKKFSKALRKIEGEPKKIISKLAWQGQQHIWDIAPEATGALKNAVRLEFKKHSEVWIVSGQPQKIFYNKPFSPKKTNKPLPYHFYIEGVAGFPYQPAKTGVNAYMYKTAQILKRELDTNLVEVSYEIWK